MFLSKIWFFLVSVIAAAAITVALVLPRPSERQRAADERQRITTACDVVNILLRTNARSRVDLANKFARSEIDVGGILSSASNAGEISADINKSGRTAAVQLIESTVGAKPTFTILVDNRGRVVARAGIDDQVYGDVLAGYYLVDDALGGYLRDDLWLIDKQLYLVAASPVVSGGYVGAVVIGHKLDETFADQFVKQLGVFINFYVDGRPAAASNTVPVHRLILEEYARVGSSDTPLAEDCRTFEPFTVDLGKEAFAAQIARLPGEAGERGAFFAVFVPRPDVAGLSGMLGEVKQGDLSFGSFPWITLGLVFVACVAVGMVLMIFETDRPLRRLNSDTIAMAQGQSERLDEERHRGKFGSIARSVNIRIDKIQREARAKKTDLDDLLGPSAASLPIATSGMMAAAPAKPPPPAAFKFSDSKGAVPAADKAPPPPPRAASAPPVRASSEAETQVADAPEDMLAVDGSDNDDGVFRRVFDEFVVRKQECSEPLDGFTYDKFVQKLRQNRDSLMEKHGCRQVRFQVYIKDGKAALKATPVKT